MPTLHLLLALVSAVSFNTAPTSMSVRSAQVTCPAVARPALAITVKNERGQALVGVGNMGGRNTFGIEEQREPDGRYTVTVKRRWYKPVTTRHIPVQYDECGPVKPTPVVVRLRPTPDAPTIREFSILGADPTDRTVIGYWPYFQRYTTFLDAPGSVSREVIWTSSRPNVATVDGGGMLRSVCNREVGRTTITATLKADLSFTSSTVFGRGGGGMVCKRGPVER